MTKSKVTAKKTTYVVTEETSLGDDTLYIYNGAKPELPESDTTETPETPSTTVPETPETPSTTVPETPETPTEPQTSEETTGTNALAEEYTVENDVPAATAPFDESLCNINGATLSFSNGNWKIEDIALGTNCNDKTISEVSYNNGEYNCTSIISKVDFPRNGASESDVNFEEYYSRLKSPYNQNLSHGYLTDDKIVLIVEENTALFNEVYLTQLSKVSGTSAVKSNAIGTKYVIEYTGNGYPQTIYVYKEGESSISELLNKTATSYNSCTSDFTVIDTQNPITLSDGTWSFEKISTHENNGTEGYELLNLDLSISNNTISVVSGSRNMISDISVLQSFLGESAYNNFLALSSKERQEFIVTTFGATMPEGASMEVSDNIVIISDPVSDGYDINNEYYKEIAAVADSIKTNSDNSKYVISKLVSELTRTDENGITESATYDEPVPTTIYLSKK